MTSLGKQYSSSDIEIIDRETVFQGFFRMDRIQLRHRLFAGGWSKPMARELFVRNEAVGILPYDPERKLVGLIEQLRVGALDDRSGPWLFELVAGVCDDGESPEAAGIREIEEEAGLTDVQLHPVCDYWVSPGGTNERLHLYCGVTNLAGAGGTFGLADEQEDIRLHVIPEEEAFLALERGYCNNSATILALLWLQLHRHELVS